MSALSTWEGQRNHALRAMDHLRRHRGYYWKSSGFSGNLSPKTVRSHSYSLSLTGNLCIIAYEVLATPPLLNFLTSNIHDLTVIPPATSHEA